MVMQTIEDIGRPVMMTIEDIEDQHKKSEIKFGYKWYDCCVSTDKLIVNIELF